MSVTITVKLDQVQAPALYRLCDKISHSDALAYLYPHLPAETREAQAYDMVYAAERVRKALRDKDVTAFPWIDGVRVP